MPVCVADDKYSRMIIKVFSGKENTDCCYAYFKSVMKNMGSWVSNFFCSFFSLYRKILNRIFS